MASPSVLHLPRSADADAASTAPPDTSAQRWLTTNELSELLDGIPPATIRGWRLAGTGPPYVQFGGLVRYERATVERWIATGGDRRPDPSLHRPRLRRRSGAA